MTDKADPLPTRSAGSSARSAGGRALGVTLVFAAVVLVALVIFIAQNSRQLTVHYLGANTSISFGVALLFAAAAGFVLAVLVGLALRIRGAVRSRR